MRVSINSSLASLVVDLTEEQALSLIKTALDLVSGKTSTPAPKPIQVYNPASMVPPAPPTPPPAPKVIPKPVPVKTKQTEKVETPQEQKDYKGFLYIECEQCGSFKAFMPKTPINRFRCDCGHETKLRDLKEMYVDCKCGQSFKYQTNAKDSVIAIDCYGCGAPVDLEYHEKNGNYQTIK